MASFSDFLEDKLLDHVFNNTAYTAPTTIYVALYSVAPTDAGGGTELSGSGYARQSVSFGAASGGVVANDADITFTASGGDWTAAVAAGLFDASTAGNMLAYGTITSTTVLDGDSLKFLTGSLTVTLG